MSGRVPPVRGRLKRPNCSPVRFAGVTGRVLAVFAIVTGFVLLHAAVGPGAPAQPHLDDVAAVELETGTVESVLDSLRQKDLGQTRWDEFFDPAGWSSADTSLWIPEPELESTSSAGRTRFDFGPRLGFNKVDGFTSGTGISAQWRKRPGLRLEGAMLRSWARGRYQGEAVASWQSDARRSAPYSWGSRTRLTGGSKEAYVSPFVDSRRRGRAWSVFGGYSERSVAFGSNRPIASAVQSLFLALDGQDYLDRIEAFGGLRLQVSRSLRSEVVYIDRRDRPIGASRSAHLHTDLRSWRNAPSERVHTRGVEWMGEWLRRGGRLEARDGLWWKATAWGGGLGGDREFYTTGIEARRSLPAPGSGSLDLEGWAAAVGGDAPLQNLADLGGSTSLRGFAPRERIGATSLLFRSNYAFGVDPLARTNIRGLRSLHLQPVLFADLGAVWGDQGWRSASDLTWPESRDWKADVGIGVQRLLNYPGLLQRVRVDFAWRLDRSTDRFRASLSLTR